MTTIYYRTLNTLKSLPGIRSIPGFNSLPSGISTENLRFYKLSNLVLTLGMFTHASWICLFAFMGIKDLALINIASVVIYIFCIVINRKGYHFSSSVIMVSEILLHQFFAIQMFGWEAGFQTYIMVITLFPFLMPKGKWFLKFMILFSSLAVFIIYQINFKHVPPIYHFNGDFLLFLQIMNILFSVIFLAASGGYFNLAMHQTEELLNKRSNELLEERNKSEQLLLNILPQETATELKESGRAQSRYFEMVTVVFTDFKNFTQFSESLSAEELVEEIHAYFSAFDRIVSERKVEKIKTIGDGYMCVGGLPVANTTNAIDAVNAAMALRDYVRSEMERRKAEGKRYFEVRIGVHTGPVVAGIVGINKFAYDIWGDTVNTASRMESSGEQGEVNVSQATFEHIKEHFNCEQRGSVSVKNKGAMEMYFVRSLKS